jgi:DsbC/DsbD-like thiol-disulfide interchange protein
MAHKRFTCFIPVVVVLLIVTVRANAQPPSTAVRWTATPTGATAPAGGTAQIKVTADLERGWHLYAMTQPKGGPTGLSIKTSGNPRFVVEAAKIVAPPPKSEVDENFSLETRFYDERTTLTVPVAIQSGTPPGPYTLALEIQFQACNGAICLRPTTARVEVPLTVSAGTE